MTRQIERWLLPIEGLASGVLTGLISNAVFSANLGGCVGCGNPFLAYVLLYAVAILPLGLIFGVMIAAHVGISRGVPSRSRLIGFVATCEAAYLVALFLGMSIHSNVVLGFVGTAIVCAGVLLFLVSPDSLTQRQLITFLPKVFGGSVACGILGACGWAIGDHVEIPAMAFGGSLVALHVTIPTWVYGVSRAHNSLAYIGLIAMVQMGAASLVGFLMPLEAIPAAPQTAARLPELKAGREGPVVAAAALLILTYGIVIEASHIQQYAEDAPFRHQREAQRKFASEHPSLTDLPAIAAPPVGQVLLLRDISGHTPGHHSVSFGGKRPGTVESVSYTVEYEQLGASPSAYRYRPCGVGCFYENEAPFANVEVVVYPTPAWAIYSTKQLARIWLGTPAFDPKTVKTISIVGNRVIRDAWQRHLSPRGEPLYFFWASGSRTVRVTFWASEDDEVLKEYLIWYPSTL